ncbi:MAG: FG-GAP-like repeat-containing protein [Thermoanaerobaculia bacterium]
MTGAASESLPGAAGVSILLGVTSAGFASPVHYAAGLEPTSVASDDIDGNGTLDLAITDSAGWVWILKGVGNGAFAAATSYSAHLEPVFVQATDLTEDGRADLAVVNRSSNDISILVSLPDGSLAAPMNFPAFSEYPVGKEPAGYTNAVALAIGPVGRFNGDTRPDLVVVNSASNDITVMSNTALCSVGCGTFIAGPQSTIPVGTTPSSVIAGDFDRDGNADLAVANSGSNDISVLISNGDGTFTVSEPYTVGTLPTSVAAGDINRDGRLDLVVANTNSDDVSVLIGDIGGAFHPAAPPIAVGSAPRHMALADFNRDAILDAAIPNTGSDSVTVLLGRGDGTFSAVGGCCAAGSAPWSVATADFDRDGIVDLAVANETTASVSILRGDGSGYFSSVGNLAVGDGPRFVAAGDFKKDGRPDLVVTNYGTTTAGTTVSVILASSTGEGVFAPAVPYTAHSRPSSVPPADLNQDRALDLAVTNYDSDDISIMPGSPDGLFKPWTAPGYPSALTSSRGTLSKTAYSYQNANVPAGDGPVSSAVADFNGDGKPDLAVADSVSNLLTILVNQECDVPEPRITMTHTGDFRQNAIGETYTITVSNLGPGTCRDSKVVSIDLLREALVQTEVGGSGWDCAAFFSCVRSDNLNAGMSFPPITVKVNVAGGAPPHVLARARLIGCLTRESEDPTTISPAFCEPSNLTATARSSSEIMVSWLPLPNAAGYWVYRRRGGGPFAQIATCGSVNTPSQCGPLFLDWGLPPATAFFYQVRAFDSAGNPGVWSDVDLATTVLLTHDPIVPGATPMRALHITQLRAAVNALLGAADLPSANFTDVIATGGVITPTHINELVASMDTARAALSLPLLADYRQIVTGDVVRAVDIQRIRAGVQ